MAVPAVKMRRRTEPVSDTAVDELIRTWRYARLNTDAPGWPELGFLGLILELGPFAAAIGGLKRSRPPPLGTMAWVNRRDAVMVQRIVEKMPPELKRPFEAFHLGIINGDNCRAWPQAARAVVLGLRRATYYDRVKMARRFVQVRVRR